MLMFFFKISSLRKFGNQLTQFLDEKDAVKNVQEIMKKSMKNFNRILYNEHENLSWAVKLQVDLLFSSA